MRRLPALVALCLATACSHGSGTAVSQLSPAPAPSTKASAAPTPTGVVFPSDEPIPTYTPSPPSSSNVHFATPQAAMTYLAAAWNRGDVASLKHVTDPAARERLQEMHREAADLKLDHCTYTKSRGDYECYFTHGFPRGYRSLHPVGTAEFTVGPATKPGWYMTYFVDCGG